MYVHALVHQPSKPPPYKVIRPWESWSVPFLASPYEMYATYSTMTLCLSLEICGDPYSTQYISHQDMTGVFPSTQSPMMKATRPHTFPEDRIAYLSQNPMTEELCTHGLFCILTFPMINNSDKRANCIYKIRTQ